MLERARRRAELDARPSDAIALALRTGAPIYCEASVLDKAATVRERASSGPAETTPDEERGEAGPRPILNVGSRSPLEILEELDPEDFGKYKM